MLNLYKDIELVEDSGYFIHNYYHAYYPNSSRLKVTPIIHYLLYGGFRGFDPGPNFDSSWYLDTYPDALKSGLNPLIYHLRFGKQRNCTYSSSGGKYIEFIGLNGSGKTILYHRLNEYLNQKLGYKPGPSKTWLKILGDARLQAGGGAYSCLIQFLIDHEELLSNIFTVSSQINYLPELPEDFNDLFKKYFYAFSSLFQAAQSDHAKPWFMIDEGFSIILAEYIVDAENKIGSELSETILNSMPKPDLLIHVNTDFSQCINRLRSRGKLPNFFQQLPDNDLINLLYKWDNTYQKFVGICKMNNINVLEIDNNNPLEDSVQRTISGIESFLNLN